MGLVGGQIYQIEEAVNLLADFKVLEKYRIVITTILSGIVVFSICGNITRIAKIFEKLLPFACCSYLLCVFVILIFNITKLPHSILIIIKEAFRLRSVTGGIVGAMCTGIKRGIFSNEAGLGSSTTPYTITKAKNALKPASIGSLNPFFVSIICVATGLIIVSSDVYLSGDGGNGIVLTKNAFASVFSWFPYVLTFIITLLAISIGISSAFNSQIIYEHFLGKKTLFVYRIILFLVMMSSNFLDLNEVINMVDTFYLSIAIPNIICLFLSRNIIKNYLLDCEKNIN
jgi:AGCS family alanine or glycine:cation symporter